MNLTKQVPMAVVPILLRACDESGQSHSEVEELWEDKIDLISLPTHSTEMKLSVLL